MKNLNITRKTLLGVALLGSFALAPLATPTAQADPSPFGRHDKKNKKSDDRDWRDDRDRREDYDRDRYDRDANYRDRYDRDQRNNRNSITLNGRVTNVRAGNSFNISVGGKIYNVYTASGLPRGLSEGDEVRVFGRPYGGNDIRNSSVVVTRNTHDNAGRDGRGDYGNSQTFLGVVTNVRNDREFDIRVGNQTFNVYATSATRRLSTNDIVRVRGQREGQNDIRNANVVVTRDRSDGRNDNRNNRELGRYQNYDGIVTYITDGRRFQVRVGGENLEIYASNVLPNLRNGDLVRVYGQRANGADIRNATVSITRRR